MEHILRVGSAADWTKYDGNAAVGAVADHSIAGTEGSGEVGNGFPVFPQSVQIWDGRKGIGLLFRPGSKESCVFVNIHRDVESLIQVVAVSFYLFHG